MNGFDDRTIVVGSKTAAGYIKKGSPGVQMSHTLRVERDAQEGSLKPQKYDSEFVKKVLAFRTSKGLNQQAFATALGLQLAVIRGIEANNTAPNNAYIQKINNYINRAANANAVKAAS
jgi:ribosome-binding protein aMBF1 (putative translation factor)